MRIFTSLLVLIVFAGCSSLKVHSDRDETVDFSQFKSFSMLGWSKQTTKEINDIIRGRFEREITSELEKRGLTKTADSAGLVVSLYISIDKQSSVTAYTDQYLGTPYYYNVGWGWGYGFSYGYPYSSGFATHYKESDYEEGTLVVDVFNNQTKRLVWQGVVSKKLERNPKDPEGNMKKAAEAVMKKFPKEPVK